MPAPPNRLSSKVQNRLDGLLMPASVKRTIAEIKQCQKQVPNTSLLIALHLISLFSNCPVQITSIRSDNLLRERTIMKMRLPGTLNIAGNGLPSKSFLHHYQVLKEKQKAHQTDDLKNNGPNKRANSEKEARDDKSGAATTHEKPSNGGGFTKAQDDALVELKLKETSWKAIATELGKEVNQVKERFKVIKPDDFDKRLMEAKTAKKSGDGCGGGNVGTGDMAALAQHGPSGGAKKEKKAQAQAQAQAHAEARGEEREDGEDWWEQSDENWTKDNLQALLSISNEELKNAFVQMSMRLADENDKEVHPASIAEKILGVKPEWI